MKEIHFKTKKAGKGVGLVSDEDFNRVKSFFWSPTIINGLTYLTTGFRDGQQKYHKIFLHRLIMSFPINEYIDHINGNTLDNRRENLRLCTQAENSRNRSLAKNNKVGATGVRIKRGKYEANIWHGKNIYLGSFDKLEDAIAARKAAEIKYFGEFKPTERGGK